MCPGKKYNLSNRKFIYHDRPFPRVSRRLYFLFSYGKMVRVNNTQGTYYTVYKYSLNRGVIYIEPGQLFFGEYQILYLVSKFIYLSQRPHSCAPQMSVL